MLILAKRVFVLLLAIFVALPATTLKSEAAFPRSNSALLRRPVRAAHGMAASTSPIASEVGVQIMKRGGNAVDAAIAVAFAEAVTHPAAGNIGGGGFMLIRLRDGKTTAIDYREMAPAAATRNVYLDPSGELIKGEGSST